MNSLNPIHQITGFQEQVRLSPQVLTPSSSAPNATRIHEQSASPLSDLATRVASTHIAASDETKSSEISNIHATAWDGKKYNTNASLQFELSRQVLTEYLLLPNDANVLDIGCGDGRISAFMAKSLVTSGQVFGIDISNDMIREAKEKYSDISNLQVSCLDASRLSYENTMDAAVSFFCMHWIEDKQPILNAIARSLKPNGQFLLLMTTRSASLPGFFGKALAATTRSDRWKIYFAQRPETYFPSTPEKMTAMIHNAGMVPTVVKDLDKDFVFKDKAGFAEWLQILPTISGPVPTGERAAFICDLINAYLELVPMREDGSIVFKRPLLLAMGTKQ